MGEVVRRGKEQDENKTVGQSSKHSEHVLMSVTDKSLFLGRRLM